MTLDPALPDGHRRLLHYSSQEVDGVELRTACWCMIGRDHTLDDWHRAGTPPTDGAPT